MLEARYRWLGEKTGVVGANDYSPVPGAKDLSPVRPAGPPSFEPLEPRLLLNGDLPDIQPLLTCNVPSPEQAVYVDLTGTTGQNDLTLRLGGGSVLEVTDTSSGAVLISRPSGNIKSIRVLGSDGADDTLRVDLRGAASWPTCLIEFVGGRGGYDSLVIGGAPGLSAEYTAIGADSGSIDLRRDLAEPIRIAFSGLEPVTVSGLGSYTFTTSGGADVITIDRPATGQNRISGTSGGVAFESVTFFNVTNLTIDTGTNDTLGNDVDSVTISDPGLVASGLQHVIIRTGPGDDVVNIVRSAGADIAVDMGIGRDELVIDPQDAGVTFGWGYVSVGENTSINYSGETEEVSILGVGTFVTEGNANDVLEMATALVLTEDPGGSGYFAARGVGSVWPSSDNDYWSFEAFAGDVVSISVDTPGSDSNLDPYVQLHDAPGTCLRSDSDGGPGRDALISHEVISTSGTYYVQVGSQRSMSGQNSSNGDYEVWVDLARGIQLETDVDYSTITGWWYGSNGTMSGANPLILNEGAPGHLVATIAGTLMSPERIVDPERTADQDIFLLGTLTAGSVVELSIGLPSTSDCDAMVSVLDSSRRLVRDDDGRSTNSHFLGAIPADGVYYAKVDSLSAHQWWGAYYFEDYRWMTWSEAEEYAQELGGHLVTISSEGEEADLEALVSDYCMPWFDPTDFNTYDPHLYYDESSGEYRYWLERSYWIGLTDQAVEGRWAWSSGEDVAYTNWWGGEDPYPGYDYAFISFFGELIWREGDDYGWIPADPYDSWYDWAHASWGARDSSSAIDGAIIEVDRHFGPASQYLLHAEVMLPTVTPDFPDLVVSQTTAPSAALSGETIHLSWEAGNVGGGTTHAASWYDRVVLSTNQQYGDADDVELTRQRYTGALDPGDGYTVETDVRLPKGITGDYYLFVETDDRDQVYEHDEEGNNVSPCSPIAITLTPYADLETSAITVPAEIRGSDLTAITWTVTNRGAETTGDGTPAGTVSDWTDRIFFSKNAIFGDADDRLAAEVQHAGALRSGESYTASWTGDVPGNYYIFAAADWDDLVYEYDDAYPNVARSADKVLIPRRIGLDTATAGSISLTGEQDEWSFYGRGGRSMTVAVNPGNGGMFAALWPCLGWAGVTILDSSGNTLVAKSSTYWGQIVVLDNVQLSADGLYRVRIGADTAHSANTGNYGIGIFDTTPDISPLVFDQQRVGTLATPYSTDRWTFSAVAGQVVLFDLANWPISGIVFDLTGPDGWIGFNDLAADSDLIVLPTAGSYTLTVRTTGGQYPGLYAFCLRNMVVTDISLGVPYAGAFVGSGQAQLFRVNVPQSSPLKIVLDDAAADNLNELYVKYEMPLTRSDYGYRSTNPASADQEILLPNAYAGDWYLLVYANTVRTHSSYALTVTAAGLILDSLTPDHHGNAADAVLTLRGAGFDPSTSVELVATDGTAYPATSVVADSFSQLTAVFPAYSAPPGRYGLRLSQADGDAAQIDDAFEVVGGGEAHFETRLVLPRSLRRLGMATLYVEYANTGTVAMPAPLLMLGSGDPDNSDMPLLTLDYSKLGQGFWTSAMPEGFSTSVQFLGSGGTPGVLQPGESCRVPVYYVGLLQTAGHGWDWSDNWVEFDLGVLTADSTTPVEWASLKNGMRPDYVQADAWDAVWANFTSQVGSTWGDYLGMLDENAAYLGRVGCPTNDITELLAFEFRQAEALSPLSHLAFSTDLSVEAPGLPIVFSRAYAQPISRRYELGPLGRGWTHNWQYSLNVAPDGTVTITDPTGTPRVFQPDIRPGQPYLSAPGDKGVLNALAGGAFGLREADGTVYAFRSDGNLDYVEDTNGNRVACGYSGGLLTSLTHSSGQSLTIAYNAAARIVSVTDPDGRQTLYTYDASNEHLVSVQQYDRRITSYAYISGQGAAREHALAQITFPGGTHQYFTYDAHGRLSQIERDEGAEQIRFSCDSTGKVTATDALSNASLFYFDDWGRIVKTQDALGNAVYLTFDDLSNLVRTTDPAGRSSSYAYDGRGNLIRSTDALGRATQFTYTSSFNRLATVTDANGNVTRYAYDTDSNLTSITYADGSVETWAYDGLGNPTAWTNRRGNPISYAYDSDGRITSKTYADGSQVAYTYDARANLISATDTMGVTTLTYDSTDYLTRIDYPGGQWLAFTYDAAGRRASSLDQTGHRLDYDYDAVGRLSSMTDETHTQIVLYEYDAAGRLVRKTVGNGVYTTYEYDAAGQLLHLVNCAPDGSVMSRFDYTYDSRGRRTSMNTSYGLWTYEHDDLGQLTHAVLDSTDPEIADQDLTYVYDALGNRIRTIENGVPADHTTNNLNQYTKVGDTTYTFDADGNLISETSPTGTITYSYDDENRLIAVHKGADSWTYHYDVFGQRTQTIHNGDVTNYIVDPTGLGNVVGEYNATGTLVARYDYGFGLLSRTSAAASARWYTFDALGSTSGLTNGAGVVANSYVYTPFGEVLQQTVSVPEPFQFVGSLGVVNEGNGLDFMRARYYLPKIGRFTSADPLSFAGDGPGLYGYAANAPALLVDPTGLSCSIWHSWWGANDWTVNPKRGPHELVVDDKGVRHSYGTKSLGGFLTSFLGFNVEGQYETVTNGKSSYEKGERFNLYSHNCRRVAENYLSKKYCAPSKKPIQPRTPPTQSQSSGDSYVPWSRDPNQKLGPGGFGESSFISNDSLFAYRIDFENEPSATAPAQIVMVTDQLDSYLDWSTFELTEIGFGDQLIPIPGGSQHFETIVPMTYNGVDFEVHIEAGIRYETGQVYASFYSIDPVTSLPPSVDIGFLPPEDGTGRGMGYIGYVIRPKAGLPTGTEIKNVGLIQFDFGEIIATNQVDPHDPAQGTDPAKECLNTIDAGIPTSSVAPLPAETNTTQFVVSWCGQDDVGGSGIASYDIFVSDNGAPYTLWKDDIADTSATFTGENGHAYAFYSVARDNVGHTEDPRAVPDTLTMVRANQPPVVGAGGDATVYEGTAVLRSGIFTDPDVGDSWTATVDYGDGAGAQPLTLNPDKTFDLSHTYAENGAYAVTLTVMDSYDESGSGEFVVTVLNVAPTVEAGADQTGDEGSLVAFAASFTDPGLIDTHAIEWNFGDGSTASGPLNPSHVYSDNGAFTATLTVTDDDGGLGSDSLIVTVSNVAPSLSNASFEIEENSPIGTIVGAILGSDPGNDVLRYSVVGGTGATAFVIDADSGRIVVCDTSQLDYETTPSFTLDVQVMDEDGDSGTATVTINLLNLASITGTVFVDVNGNGLYDANEPGIDGVCINLLNPDGSPIPDALGNPTVATTSSGGFYLFEDLDAGAYRLHEAQPTGVNDGAEILGSLGGMVVANDTMQLTLERVDASDYCFAEIGQQIASGDTAGIGFWQNKHGQALIRAGGTALAAWLTRNFGNIFGDTFIGADGDDVASFYRDELFRQKSSKSAGPAKVDAQFMALALSTYFTSSYLAGSVAGAYGFRVTDTGIGTKIVNVGDGGAAFAVADGTHLTIMQLLLATNNLTDHPGSITGFASIYDLNGDGDIDDVEAVLRRLANEVYSAINEQGGI